MRLQPIPLLLPNLPSRILGCDENPELQQVVLDEEDVEPFFAWLGPQHSAEEERCCEHRRTRRLCQQDDFFPEQAQNLEFLPTFGVRGFRQPAVVELGLVAQDALGELLESHGLDNFLGGGVVLVAFDDGCGQRILHQFVQPALSLLARVQQATENEGQPFVALLRFARIQARMPLVKGGVVQCIGVLAARGGGEDLGEEHAETGAELRVGASELRGCQNAGEPARGGSNAALV